MSIEETAVQIDVTVDNAEAISSLNEVNRSLGNLEDGAEATESAIKGTDRATRGLSSGLNSVSGSSNRAESQISKLAKGFLTLELAKKALEVTTRVLISSFNDYAATSAQNTQAQTAMVSELAELKSAFAEALFGGGNFELIVSEIRVTLELMTRAINTAAPAMQDLFGTQMREATGILNNFLPVLITFLEQMQRIVDVFQYLTDIVNPFDTFTAGARELSNVFSGESGLGEALKNYWRDVSGAEAFINPAVRAQDELTASLQRTTVAQAQASLEARRARYAAGQAAAAEAEAAGATAEATSGLNSFSSWFTRISEMAPAAQEGIRGTSRAVDELAEQLQIMENRNADLWAGFMAASAEVRAEEEERLGAIQDAADREFEIRSILNEKIKNQAEQTAAAALETNRLLQEQLSEQEELAAIQRQEKINEIANIAKEAGGVAGDFLSAGLDAAVAGKDFGKVALKMFGDYLASKGQAMFVEGTVDTAVGIASGNPKQIQQGGAEIAGGIALMAAGKGIGGAAKGKGGGGARASAAPTASAQPVQNTVNQVVNFGFVGDRRAAARDVAGVTEQGLRLGYQ